MQVGSPGFSEIRFIRRDLRMRVVRSAHSCATRSHSLQLAPSERLSLSRNSVIRGFVAILASIALATSPLSVAGAATSAYPKTLSYLSGMFVGGRYVEGFTPGRADYGFTIEAMLQRLAGGLSANGQRAAVDSNFINNTNIGTSTNRHGYLFDSSGELILGAAGKYLFAGRALGVANVSNRNGILALLKRRVASNGVLAGANGNAFDYSWVALALVASGESNLAQRVAATLASFARSDGGFGLDTALDTNDSSTDATGIALQAIAAVRAISPTALGKKLGATSARAVSYLLATQISGNHWQAWGDFDTNGTAYAAMGLRACGRSITNIRHWLASKIATDGGIESAWSGGAGDPFATAQAYAPLLGLSYVDLIGLVR